ncbi:MAG: hypothetical protein V4517_08870 [Pseudomonadota bacterium]
MPKMIGVAVAWMRKEDWPRWLAIDPDFQPDYEHWLKRMETAVKGLEQQGSLCEKVIIDPEEFVEWCRVNRCKVDSKGRSTYAAQILAKRYDASH